ncbi:uncharacterized protein LOC141594048 [Silene latifolia]|uniref:uncharacterized protein LOC141594048 n=1 Tax=Silene latifolia TaxID=37657 RepID=UPI003D782573
MEFESIKKYIEKQGKEDEATKIDKLPYKLFDPFIAHGLQATVIEPGRILCTFKVPPRLVNTANTLHGGAIASLVDLMGTAVIFTVAVGAPTTGVSVEINVSYLDAVILDEEIEIEAKVLRVGKSIGVVSVELRKKANGKIVAQGRHTKYLPVTSKL